MVNTVLNAISTKLYSTFGNTHHYYVENVEQNLTTPCFTIDVLNPLNRSVNSKDYYRTFPCVVHYFSDDKGTTKRDCYSVGEQLLETLEYITIGSKQVRGEDFSYSMVDDVLVMFVTYRFWTEKELPPETDMEDITVQQPTVT